MIKRSDLDKIKKSAWSHEIFEGVPFYIFGPAESEASIFKYYPVYFSTMLGFFSSGKACWHYIEKDQESIANYLVDRIKKEGKYSLRLVSSWLEDSKRFYRLYGQMMKLDFSKSTEKKLGESFCALYNSFLPLGARSFILEGFSFKADVILAEMLKEVLKRNGCSNLYEQAFTILAATSRDSFLQEAEKELFVLYKKHSQHLFERAIDKYLVKYAWLHNNYAGTGSLDKDWVMEQVKEIKKKSLLKFDQAKTVLRKKKMLAKIKATRELINLSKAIDDFVYWQDQRKKMVFHVIEAQKKLLTEFSRRWGVEKGLLEYLTPAEFGSWICNSKPIALKELRLRQKNCCIIVKRGSIELVSKNVAEINKLVITKYSDINIGQELKGSVANLGKARGIVKIVLSVKDMDNFEAGSILVSSMTRPDMTPALKKARAIVTDDGGITCHAAIVSRELGVPCIVGTKVATRVLKDGDEVEVDANTGRVYIIKS